MDRKLDLSEGTGSATARVVACAQCDLLQRVAPVPRGGRARCACCGDVLARAPGGAHGLSLALTLTAAVVFLVANATPLMAMSAVGREASTTIIGGAWAMWQQDQPVTGALVMFCAVVAPALFILLMLALLSLAGRPGLPAWCGEALRWGLTVQPWAMFEVMLLGILVALIKIAQLATVEPGIGLVALGLLALLFPAIIVSFDADAVWRRIAWAEGAAAAPQGGPEAPR